MKQAEKQKSSTDQPLLLWPSMDQTAGQAGLEMDATETRVIKLATILESAQERGF